jgi:hypothetical protein
MLGRTNIARYIELRKSPATNEDVGFPTWVPLFHRCVPYRASLSTYDQALNWATSCDSAVHLGPISSPRSLVLKELRLGAVAKCYTYREYYSTGAPGLESLFAQVKNDLHNYQGPDSIVEAFEQTIAFGDSKIGGFDASNHDPFQSLSNPVFGYRMFLTGDGHIGFGQPPLLGNEIWLLLGGRTLYALRRKEDDTFIFAGECFVHGYMNGEGMELWKAGKLESEWVDIL